MSIWLWLGFLALVSILIALDLRIARRRARDASPRAAIGWSIAWIAVSIAFGGLLFLLYDTQWAGLGTEFAPLHGAVQPLGGEDAFRRFLTAYILEAALNLDNLFVISLILSYFRLPRSFQHTVLFAGAYVAIAIRGLWIAIGIGLLSLAPWMTYLFGGALLLAAVKMLTLPTGDPDPDSNPAIRLIRRLYPVSTGHSGRRFLTRLPLPPPVAPPLPSEPAADAPTSRRGRLALTPLFAALLMVESADAVYALGSVPAAIGVAKEPLIVFSSNILAVLTVRPMYHALAPVLHRFTYVLLFVSLKMFLAQHFVITPEVSLSVIVGILCVGAAASLVSERGRPMEPPLGHDVERYARLTVQQARKLIILVIGLSTLAMSVPIGILLPGPGGIPIAILGLMILATEFVWARRLLRQARQRAGQAAAEAERRLGFLSKFRQAREWATRRFGRSSAGNGREG
jgi:tellurite resistance protein TerC